MKNLIYLTLLILLVSTSCKKDLYDKYNANPKVKKTVNSTGEMVVDKDFDWKTSRDVSINLTGTASSPVLITTLDGKIIEKSMLTDNQTYHTVISIPSTEKSVIFHYMGKLITVEVKQSTLSYNFK